MMDKAVMISLPMAGRTDKQIRDTWDKAAERLRSMGYVVLDSLFDDSGRIDDDALNEPLYYLGKSFIVMALANTVYFCDGWDNYRGCIIEHAASKAYGLNIIYESDNIDDR